MDVRGGDRNHVNVLIDNIPYCLSAKVTYLPTGILVIICSVPCSPLSAHPPAVSGSDRRAPTLSQSVSQSCGREGEDQSVSQPASQPASQFGRSVLTPTPSLLWAWMRRSVVWVCAEAPKRRNAGTPSLRFASLCFAGGGEVSAVDGGHFPIISPTQSVDHCGVYTVSQMLL